MRRWIGPVLAVFLLTSCLSAGPQDAVVRIPSHGISGTVIYAGEGRSLILSCAHGFQDPGMVARSIVLDVPASATGGPRHVGVRLLVIDFRRDLSLIEVNVEVPNVCAVPRGDYRLSSHLVSVGYDKMCAWPPVCAQATYRGKEGPIILTTEDPVPGRSGGGLIDAEQGVLIGVCQGYETVGQHRGRYVSRSTILEFLTENSDRIKSGGGGGGGGGPPVVVAPARPGPAPGGA